MYTFSQLHDVYTDLWGKAKLRPERKSSADEIAGRIIKNKDKYDEIQQLTHVPWYLVGCLHDRESGQNFSRHLHNGCPLSRRTRLVPAGRPPSGTPPFTFVESAVDALTMTPHRLNEVPAWPIERILYEAERYNGWGYRIYHPSVLSPYLWSFTNLYSSGKYVQDGRFDPKARDQQCGVAATIIAIINLVPDVAAELETTASRPVEPDYDVAWVQEALNHVGASPKLKIDGIYGAKTRAAVKAFQKEAKLFVDGIAGPMTVAALKVRLEARKDEQRTTEA